MDIESINEYVSSLHFDVEATQPFGPDTIVFKIYGKVFLLLSLDEIPTRINLKCDPEKAIELREQYAAIIPGYHMNKKHWNTVIIDGSLNNVFLKDLIKDSYDLIVAKMPKNQRELIKRG